MQLTLLRPRLQIGVKYTYNVHNLIVSCSLQRHRFDLDENNIVWGERVQGFMLCEERVQASGRTAALHISAEETDSAPTP